MEEKIEKIKIHLPGKSETSLEQLESQIEIVKQIAKEYERLFSVKLNIQVIALKEGSFDFQLLVTVLVGLITCTTSLGSFIIEVLRLRRDMKSIEKIEKDKEKTTLHYTDNSKQTVNNYIFHVVIFSEKNDNEIRKFFNGLKNEQRESFEIISEEQSGINNNLTIEKEDFYKMISRNPYFDYSKSVFDVMEALFRLKTVRFKGDAQWEIIVFENTIRVKVMDIDFKNKIQNLGKNVNSKTVYTGQIVIIYSSEEDKINNKVQEYHLMNVLSEDMIQ